MGLVSICMYVYYANLCSPTPSSISRPLVSECKSSGPVHEAYSLLPLPPSLTQELIFLRGFPRAVRAVRVVLGRVVLRRGIAQVYEGAVAAG